MKMKHQVLLITVILAGLAFVSCKKEIPESGIRFQANLSSEDTRTSYSGEGTYTDGKLSAERIDWVDGDLMTIYSPEAVVAYASSLHSADYLVNSHSTFSAVQSRAVLAPAIQSAAGMPNGLQWGSGEHHFYGMYPSANTEGYTATEKAKISVDATRMTGVIPQDQVLALDGPMDILFPPMVYAYMFAKQSAPASAQAVNLSFGPEFSAFEFTISSGQNDQVDITSFSLSSATKAVVGDFTIPTATPWETETFTFSNTRNSVTVDFSNLTYGKLVVKKGFPVTFTVFALPQDLDNLTISFTGTQIGTRSLALNDASGNPLAFQGRKKYRLFGFSFPEILHGTGEDIIWDHTAFGEGLIWSLYANGQKVIWDQTAVGYGVNWDMYASGKNIGWDQTASIYGISWGENANGFGINWGVDANGTPIVWDQNAGGNDVTWEQGSNGNNLHWDN